MTDPETVTAEGTTLGEAIRAAAEQLGVEPAAVSHKFDAEHFRNQYGAVSGSETVKIHAWVRDRAEFEGGEAARAYIEKLIEEMGLNAEVKVRIRADQQAAINIDSDKAAILVGRQGSTIKSIRHLLAESVGREYPDWTFHIDISGPEDRDDDGGRGRRDRDDDRGRGRGRRDRDDDRGRGRRDRDDDRGRRGKRSKDDLERLQGIARKVAENVLSTGEAEVIRKRLNSYERRAVHIAVAEIDGVQSESIKQDGEKRVEISRVDGSEE